MEHTSHTPHPKINYVGIFAWLFAFTIIELIVSLLPLPGVIQIPTLVAFAVAKATLVVLYYMHLRYDSRWYALILIVGVLFALLLGRLLPAILK